MTGPSFRADRIYVGWQHLMLHPDPGPPPRRPAGPAPERVDPGWLAARRREHARISLPYRVSAAVCAAAGMAAFGLARAGTITAALALAAGGACAAAATWNARQIWRGRRELGAAVAAERRRVAAAREARRVRLADEQTEHQRRFHDWQERREAFERSPQWFPVHLPDSLHRIDVLGGTAAGWSALLTMVGAARLAAGGEVTVVDLSRWQVARDLVALAEGAGTGPLLWVLPDDLPRFDLGIGMPHRLLSDALASAAADPDGQGPEAAAARARDQAILDRVLDLLGEAPSIAAVTAGLRALAQVGDPRRDLERGALTGDQLEAVTAMFGRTAAERVVVERAWALEARLRALETLGAGLVPLPPSRLRVIAVDRAAGGPAEAVLGGYVATALAHLLRALPARQRWRHTLCVAGADRLADDVLDRLADTCELSGTGLMLAFRSAPPRVRARLGRGHAAVVFMRAGNAEDAKAASEQIGTEHRFVISQLTDTVGQSVTDTVSDSYTSTVSSSDSLSTSVSASWGAGRSRGRGHSKSDIAPLSPRTGTGHRERSDSWGRSESASLTEGITRSTSWGASTARALGGSVSFARAAQRSREFLVEPHELQQLPPSAVIVTYAAPGGRQVVLADANPGIAALPTATLASPDETVPERPPGAARAAGAGFGHAGGRTEGAGAPAGPPPGPGGQTREPQAPAREAQAPAREPQASAREPQAPAREPQAPAREPVSWRARQGRPPPNLGPPEPPFDWRRR